MKRDSLARQRGSSLLEVLIAMVIMSFGLLAMAGLTASSQQYVKMAQFQSIGMQLASELSERMRSNVTGFELGSYQKEAVYSGTKVALPTCVAVACVPKELAELDIAIWTNELQRRLPGGDAFVKRDAINSLATDIWIMWIDPDLRETGAAASEGKSVANASDCPAAAVGGLAKTTVVRCMYYRVSI